VYYSALLVDFLRVESESVGPVVEYEQAGVYVALQYRHIVDIVDCFVGGGIGIEVLAEFHADAFAVVHDAVALEVFRAVEAHVLEEVRQSALRVVFLYRADFLRYVEIGALPGKVVVAYVVGQPVGKFPVSYG
jgi:hypothetical protein